MLDTLSRSRGIIPGLLLILAVLMAISGCSMDEPEGSLQIAGDIGTDEALTQEYCLFPDCQPLNEADVEAAAQPLVDRGATVVVILDRVEAAALLANPNTSREQLFDWLERLGYADATDPLSANPFEASGQLRTGQENLIAVYIGLSLLGDDAAFIAYGADWSDHLSSQVDNIMDEQLRPSVDREFYSTAVVDTLAAIEVQLP